MHAILTCPICENPRSRVVLEGSTMTMVCKPCDMAISWSVNVLKPPSADACLKGKKFETLTAFHNTLEIGRAVHEYATAKAAGAKDEDLAVLESAIVTAVEEKRRGDKAPPRKE